MIKCRRRQATDSQKLKKLSTVVFSLFLVEAEAVEAEAVEAEAVEAEAIGVEAEAFEK